MTSTGADGGPATTAGGDNVPPAKAETADPAPTSPSPEAAASPKKPKAKKTSKSPGASSPKTPRAGSTSARRGRSVGASSKKRGATPGTAKRKVAASSAHIPKRALSFGRPPADAGLSPNSDGMPAIEPGTPTASRQLPLDDAASPPEQLSPIPTGAERIATDATGLSLADTAGQNSVAIRKPTLRLYGEAAEGAVDVKTRAACLFNIGWIYGTGTTGVPQDLEKAYAYFYHAAQDQHPRAQFYMAMLQLTRGLGAAPEFDPASVGSDEASPARRGRSASPRRGASPKRAASRAGSPSKKKASAKKSASGPFGGLRRAVENLRACMESSDGIEVEATVLLAQLSDPDFPAPPGYVEPTPSDAAEQDVAETSAMSATQPVITRTYDAALELYKKAAASGSSAAEMRVEDIEAQLAKDAEAAAAAEENRDGAAAAA